MAFPGNARTHDNRTKNLTFTQSLTFMKHKKTDLNLELYKLPIINVHI